MHAEDGGTRHAGAGSGLDSPAGTDSPTGTDTVGLVLAAGGGSRLGRGAKALLRSGGVTLVERAIEALAGGGCSHVLVVVGAQAEEVAAQATRARVVRNNNWQSGLASSFLRGMAAVPGAADRVVVTLVDQPLIGPEVVARLLARHQRGRIAAATYRQPGSHGGAGPRHPMVFDAALAGEAARSARGDHGARDFLRRHPDLLDLVDCCNIGSAADVDTTSDLHLLGP